MHVMPLTSLFVKLLVSVPTAFEAILYQNNMDTFLLKLITSAMKGNQLQ